MERVVYIHGVVPQGAVDHTTSYRAFRDGLSSRLDAEGHDALPPLADSVTVEWGFPHPLAGDTASLARAQEVITRRVDAATPSDRTSFSALLFAPAIEPVRGLIQHTWADIVHYVSEKGKARIRNVVWGRMLELIDPHEPTDLTVIGHSAGSLIAVDLLFWLFSHQRDDPDELRAMGLDPDEVEAAHTTWRVRRLVTFGSPIAALLIRSTAVTDILAADGTLDAADLGLGTRCHDGQMPLWLNVWDRHDVLAYPVEPFYTGAEIHDLYPDHSDSLLGSHEAYWHADRVHRVIADAWGRQPGPLT